VFSYMKGYRYSIQSSHRFKIVPGTHTTILVIPFDKGGGLTSMKDRLAVRYESHVSTLGLRRDSKGRGAAPAPSKTNP
ncbi:MAG: dihydrolipoamide acetyltransferase, partial [Polyangia bacterium]|nr:dihydrolipoamide acetyltransferase [Polyangia bacterium]